VGLLEIRSENKTVLDKITIVELSDKLMYRAKAKLGSHIEKGVIDL
jgi:hypothetical protein